MHLKQRLSDPGDVTALCAAARCRASSGAEAVKVTADAPWYLDALPSHDSAFVVFAKSAFSGESNP